MSLPKIFPILLLMLLTCCYAAAQNSEQEVRKLERAWLDAYEQNDARAMEAIVADDFTITFPDGSIQTKPQILNSIKAARGGNHPPMKFYTEDVQARVYGETVVLIGRVVTEWQRDGKPSKQENRYTDTYARRGGRWQVVASHLSNVPKPKNQPGEVSSNAGKGRSVNKNKIVSLANPAIRIEVDDELQAVGILNFVLKNVAQVERYVYAAHDENKRIRRLFIAQFEAFLPGAKGSYTFQVVNPTRLGNFDYQTDVGVYNFAERIAANPGAEPEVTKALFDRNSLKVDDDYLVARYARITDAVDKRHELILFYFENLRDLGFTRAQLESNGSRTPEAEKLFREFAARAARSFKIVD
ncbi:MAG TPA: nuclear transport factor 2 family protein [Pyrinomonadaceae bacterium]|nr:nuclear transport factor 2 family protein [Pyrinomonadaceae bacterium]